jgi:prophage regulatory protein
VRREGPMGETSDAAGPAPEPSAAPPRPEADPLLNTKQVERLLQVGNVTFWRWRKEHTFDVPPFYDGGGPIGVKLWRQSDVLRWIAERPRRKDPGGTTYRRGKHPRPAPAVHTVFSRSNEGRGGRAALKILRLPEVMTLVGLSQGHIYYLEARGKFPRSVSIGPNTVGWYAGEVKSWLEGRRRTRPRVITVAEKRAIIRRVKRRVKRGSKLSVKRTLRELPEWRELGLSVGMFYLWCRQLGIRPPKRRNAAEKLAIIRRVQRSKIPVDRMLAELGIHRVIFYLWCQQAGIRPRRGGVGRGPGRC